MISEKYGKVVKGLGGLFEVKLHNSDERIVCRAKGVLRRDEERVLVGDDVRVTVDAETPDGRVISEILERKNSLIRPPLANLDYLFIVFAAKRPAPVLETVDKLVAISVHNGIEPVVVVTKSDMDAALAESYADIYKKIKVTSFVTSSLVGVGADELRAYINENVKDGKTAAFAGASGVGKSTVMNTLFPELALATGEISRKIERGRHTTRHVELFPLSGEENCGFIADTPGFSLIDFERFDFFELDDLAYSFPELRSYRGSCRYADCAHVGESADDCAVARASELGEIPESRLASYRAIYKVLKEKKKYD
ncbi:MAG: ribosome small subunit-dependent GTPase A [Clostridia bacterium]|nr:ribosome small subunit-dependent GTPase A [Clostridia bacterium]